MEIVEIYTSKKKSALLLIGSIAFVALGIWILLNAENLRGHSLVNQVMGVVGIIFFGFGIFVAIKRLLKSEIALIISKVGLNVNPKKSLSEFIRWEDILGFEEIKIRSTKFVIIGVRNPGFWLEKETNAFRKKLMQFNTNNYGSPFNIAASGLDIDSNELIEKLQSYFEKYKNEVQQGV